MELIYCAGGNPRFAKIAIDTGWLYGSQLPSKVYYPIHFADQDWKKPDLQNYLVAIDLHRPRLATVLDWEYDDQLAEVLSWAEAVAQFVETVIVIPKVIGGISKIPHAIGGKPVRLGYSVPTRYGGTSLTYNEFGDRPVHLLGGNPHLQRKLSSYMNVVSLDGNYTQMMAVRYNEFWSGGKWHELSDYGGFVKTDAPYEAFRRSCENVMAMWQGKNYHRHLATKSKQMFLFGENQWSLNRYTSQPN